MTDNILKYKGFCGSVDYSANDESFFGKIVDVSDLVTFEGDSVVALKEAFAEAVEDYIVLCKEVGKEPQKTYEGYFNIRISPDLHREAAIIASNKGLTLNALVEKALYSEVYS